MPATKYIILTSDDAVGEDPPSLGGRYIVIQADPGLRHTMRKSQSMNETVEGGLDVGMGGVYEIFTLMLRTRHTEDEENYGDLADLRAMYALNDPFGTPSNVLKYTDHHGDTHNVWMIGNLDDMPLTFQVEGLHAWYTMPITLQKVPA